MDSSLIILISFLVFAYFLYKKFWPNILQMLDEHSTNIQRQFDEIQIATLEQEQLETFNQRQLNDLQKEIDLIKLESLKKIEFLKQKLSEDMEYQYTHRQKGFQQSIKRIKTQQKKALQSRCIDEIFQKIMQKIQKNSSTEDKYMLSVTQLVNDDSNFKA